jgi:hypothetical protein
MLWSANDIMSEARKIQDYRGVGSLVADGNFVPFAVETSGRLGPAATAYLTRIAGANNNSLIRELSDRVGLVIASSNGLALLSLRRDSLQVSAR